MNAPRTRSELDVGCWMLDVRCSISPMFDVINNAQQSRVDRLQLAATAVLMLLGTAFVYSATMIGDSAGTLALYNQAWFRQIVWYALGLTAAVGFCVIDYRSMARWSFVIYWLMILLLIAVLIP